MTEKNSFQKYPVNMRFHVISLPHTQTTKAYANCAYTAKVIYFCKMMKSLGHEVFLYAGEENEADVTELITCISEKDRAKAVGNNHFTSASFDNSLPHWQSFNNKAIAEMSKRIQQKDFVCIIGGTTQKPIADAFPNHMAVEWGIGYGGTFAKYRVFESHAWRHSIYAMFKNPTAVDGFAFDRVINGYLDPEMFPLGEKKEDYYLYLGRMIQRKGVDIASQVCEKLGVRLIMAGPGDYIPKYGEYIGSVDTEQRTKLLQGAIATFTPTQYIEPFCNVHIESMAVGTPVITSDWGVFTETVANGFNGYRCNTFQDYLEAAEKVKDLNNKDIREVAIDTYSIDVIKYKYDAYFRDLMKLWDLGWYEIS
jgi:glycosyltransferase involved in cell wall biosynthesis